MAETQERAAEPLTAETEEFAQQISDQVESFLIAVRAIARGEATGGEAISMLERRAMEAERDTVDRYVAAYLADQVGQLVECRITGVQPFGFFATVENLGGDGLVLARDPDQLLRAERIHRAAQRLLQRVRQGHRRSQGNRRRLHLPQSKSQALASHVVVH